MRWFLGMLGMVALLGCQIVPAAATMARPVAAMAQSQTGAAFQPAKTYALLIGILEWRDPDLEPFPKENRQDRALERTLLARGVPRDQIVFLEDKQATLTAIRASLKALQAKAGKDSTLIVYFAGHGLQEYGKTWFCNYDVACERPQQTGFGLAELGDTLAKGFRGGRVLLTADCCHSGALADVVKTVGKAGIRAASLSSVSPTDGSTERWTFTESLVRAWQGEGRIDLNGDGAVTFGETDTFVHDQMKYGEDQLTHGELAGGFESAWRFAVAAPLPPGAFAGREYAECQRQNTWERVQLLARKPDAALVHYMTLGDRFDEWVPTSRLRPIPTTRYKVGQRIEVDYDGVWEPAQVTKQAEDFFLFVNYSKLEDCNEWVTDLRVRPAGQPKVTARVKSLKRPRH